MGLIPRCHLSAYGGGGAFSSGILTVAADELRGVTVLYYGAVPVPVVEVIKQSDRI